MKNNIIEDSLSMNEVKFRNLSSTEQLQWVNHRLQETGNKVDDIAKEIGISSSSISSLMKKSGYSYSRVKKQYIPMEEKEHILKDDSQEFMEYLLANAGVIKKIVEESNSKQIIFDSSIFQTDSPFTSKTVKIKNSTLEEFQQLLKEKFPQFRTQDVLTQAIIDFIKKYK